MYFTAANNAAGGRYSGLPQWVNSVLASDPAAAAISRKRSTRIPSPGRVALCSAYAVGDAHPPPGQRIGPRPFLDVIPSSA
jgi:hypothetical protein